MLRILLISIFPHLMRLPPLAQAYNGSMSAKRQEWRARMKRILLVCGILLGSLVCSAQTGSVAGEWRGIWTDPTGYVFTVTMTLETGPGCKTCAATGDGSIRGK